MSRLIRRNVSTSFWEDSRVVDEFTPEDKYFMLYLLTNPHTTQAGIYKLPYKIAAFELGYSVEATRALLDRFDAKYSVIRYSKKTQEVAILSSLKYSVVKGGKPVADCITSDLEQIEDTSLIVDVYKHLSTWWDESARDFDHSVKDLFVKELKRRKVPKEVIINDKDNDNDKDNIVATNRVTNRATNRKSSEHSSLTVKQLASEFKSLWERYPNKKGKKQAFNHYKAWRKEKKDHTYLYISKKLNDYLKYIRENNVKPRYIMHGSTWFNGRFDDDLKVDDVGSDPNDENSFTNLMKDDPGQPNEDDFPF